MFKFLKILHARFTQSIQRSFVYFSEKVESVDSYKEFLQSDLQHDKEYLESILKEPGKDVEYLKDVEQKINAAKTKLLDQVVDQELKAKIAFKLDVAGFELMSQLRQLVDLLKKKIEQEKVRIQRENFIRKFPAHDRAYLTGLLGLSNDPEEWQKLSEKDSGVLEKTFINGLLERAKTVFSQEQPKFMTMERYQAYLEMNKDSEELMTPEEFLEKGFLNLPERSQDALSGSDFVEKILGVSKEDYQKNDGQTLGKLSRLEIQNAILTQIEMGNIPSFLRKPVPITVTGKDGTQITTFAMPDVMAIGNDTDYIRVPISPVMAKALADYYGLALPTKTLIQATYEEAGRTGKQVVAVKYDPFEVNPKTRRTNSAYMDSVGFYAKHNQAIKAQTEGMEPGTLLSGHKKELATGTIVASPQGADQIGFYGLFDGSGYPIQTSPGHGGEEGFNHTEYPLGFRGFSHIAFVRKSSSNAVPRFLSAVYKDKELAPIINRKEYSRDKDQKVSDIYSRGASEGPFDPDKAYQFVVDKKPRVAGLRLPYIFTGTHRKVFDVFMDARKYFTDIYNHKVKATIKEADVEQRKRDSEEAEKLIQ